MAEHSAPVGQDIAEAAAILCRGGLVAIPTETVYGLAANGLDSSAVLKIFEAKNRPHFDPLILHVSSLADLDDLVTEVPPLAHELAQKFWPGPLTLLLEKTSKVPDLVTSGLPTVAVRVPDHAVTQTLLSATGFPLAAPSANPFGYVSPTSSRHVADQLGAAVDYILEGGECEVGLESTIIGFEKGRPVVFRLGGLPLEVIEEVTGPLQINTSTGSSPAAPGMIRSHYAPGRPLTIGDIGSSLAQAQQHGDASELGVLAFSQDWSESGVGACEVLSRAGSLAEAAHNLFACLRRLDSSPVSRLIAEPVPDTGLGRAINDRLRRAAAASD